MTPSVLHMLVSACESARSGYGAHVCCWILTGVSARLRTAAALNRRLSLESDLLAESSIFVAESDGCPSQFAFHSHVAALRCENCVREACVLIGRARGRACGGRRDSVASSRLSDCARVGIKKIDLKPSNQKFFLACGGPKSEHFFPYRLKMLYLSGARPC
jgi:hypothetical protein